MTDVSKGKGGNNELGGGVFVALVIVIALLAWQGWRIADLEDRLKAVEERLQP